MIYVFERHDELLTHWRERNLSGIRLAHVDFHDDMRGLLIDRARRRAYRVGALARDPAPVDPGNFLAHAIVERRVESVRWIHGPVGGRAWDMGIVRYETDLFALPARLRHRRARGTEYPLDFEELLLDRWNGPADEELLSIDWDCFASTLLDAGAVDARATAFVERLGAVVPHETYVVYSPEYSHDSLASFSEFVARLSTRLGQDAEWADPALRDGRRRAVPEPATLPDGPVDRLILWLRRRGVF